MPQSIDYAAEMSEFTQRHPQMRGRVTLIDPTDTRSGANIANEVWERVVPQSAYGGSTADTVFLDRQKQVLGNMIDQGVGFNMEIKSTRDVPTNPNNPNAGRQLQETVHQHVIVSPQESLRDSVVPRGTTTPEMAHQGRLWYLHHELGHSLTSGRIGIGAARIDEAAADTYATIRHMERFGADSTFPQAMADMRTIEAIHSGQADHFTANAIQDAAHMQKSGAFNNLTPDEFQTRILDAAQSNAMSPEDARLFENTFQEFRDGFNNNRGNHAAIDPNRVAARLGEIGAESNSPQVKNWVGNYLDAAERTYPPDVLDRRVLNESRSRMNTGVANTAAAEQSRTSSAGTGNTPDAPSSSSTATATQPTSRFSRFLSKGTKLLGVAGLAGVGYEVSQLERNANRALSNNEISQGAHREYQGVIAGHIAQATADPTLIGGEVAVQRGYDTWANRHGVEGSLRDNMRPSALTDLLKKERESNVTTRGQRKQRQRREQQQQQDHRPQSRFSTSGGTQNSTQNTGSPSDNGRSVQRRGRGARPRTRSPGTPAAS
ncbi:MAG: hypothetical protein EA357_11500 [Micavibrio sp.]|nr:MAG: hypothetical protein EA357_11500 [Micavibrio sp.]